MTGFAIDPSALESNAPVYNAYASELADINQTLTSKLHAEGACWGNDDAGTAFEAKYLPPAITALSQLLNAGDGMQSTAAGLLTWYENLMMALEQDQQSAKSIGT